jgi:hypothetical protein
MRNRRSSAYRSRVRHFWAPRCGQKSLFHLVEAERASSPFTNFRVGVHHDDVWARNAHLVRRSEQRYSAFVQLNPDAFDVSSVTSRLIRPGKEEQRAKVIRYGRAQCKDASLQRRGWRDPANWSEHLSLRLYKTNGPCVAVYKP